MKHTDIWYGSEYMVKDRIYTGRAVVVGPKRMSRLTGKYEFPVKYPDAKDNQRQEEWVGSRDFIHIWSEDDQERFDKERKHSAFLRTVEDSLVAAGFEPAFVRNFRVHLGEEMKLYIGFQGDPAERVVEILLQHAQQNTPAELAPPAQQLEAGDE